MYNFIISQSPSIFYLLLLIFAIIIAALSYKFGIFINHYKSSRVIQKMEKEKKFFYKESREIWEQEKQSLLNENTLMKDQLESYRKKISGLGMLSFGGSKKRSDILYSLLMENETLEQILHEQSQKLAVEQRTNLDQRLLDIRKRQRLLGEIFNDNKIKDYVKEVLQENNLKKVAEKS